VVGGNLGGPSLNLATADLDSRATTSADQVMMMVRCCAPPVDRFAGVGANHIDQIGGCQRLQGAIDGCQSDVLASAPEFVV